MKYPDRVMSILRQLAEDSLVTRDELRCACRTLDVFPPGRQRQTMYDVLRILARRGSLALYGDMIVLSDKRCVPPDGR